MVRKSHVVQTVGMGRNPDAFCIVQAGVKQQYESDADETGNLRLARWYAGYHRWINGVLVPEKARKGDTADDFWAFLAARSVSDAAVWIVSMSAREQCAALGLWDRVLENTATLEHADPWTRDLEPMPGQPARNGFVILEGPPTIVVFRNTAMRPVFTWIDPANYGTGRLQRTGDYPPEMRAPANHWGDNPWQEPSSVDAQAHAVRVWLESYLRCLTENKLGAIEHTAASQAHSSYRRQYMDYAIHVHDSAPVLDMERAALYGGRCEANFIGTVYAGEPPLPVRIPANDNRPYYIQGDWAMDAKEVVNVPQPTATLSADGPIYHLDVNSLYPAVAATHNLPTKLITTCKFVSTERLLQACRAICVVARVKVRIDAPCVPYRTEKLTLFPVGTFWATLCGPEILLAAEHGRILSCETLCAYEARPIYRTWVETLYRARRNAADRSDKAQADCLKRILNSSFGKWAQRSRKWIDVPDDIPPAPFYQWWQVDKASGEMEQWRAFAWQVQRQVDAGEPAGSCPVITAYINSLGRVRLWEIIMTAGQENVYYYDTDSAFTNTTGLANLHAANMTGETELGKLKVVGKHECVTFHGVKKYAADGVLTMAGARDPVVKSGDAFALQLRSPPVEHYLHKMLPPGLDRHVSRVLVNTPYELGDVEPSGWVNPKRIDADARPGRGK